LLISTGFFSEGRKRRAIGAVSAPASIVNPPDQRRLHLNPTITIIAIIVSSHRGGLEGRHLEREIRILLMRQI
jgi:hypothetical protein